MDIYLPAEFRELHDAAPDDWRDLSSAATLRDERTLRSGPMHGGAADTDPDPLWCVV